MYNLFIFFKIRFRIPNKKNSWRNFLNKIVFRIKIQDQELRWVKSWGNKTGRLKSPTVGICSKVHAKYHELENNNPDFWDILWVIFKIQLFVDKTMPIYYLVSIVIFVIERFLSGMLFMSQNLKMFCHICKLKKNAKSVF